MGKISISQLKAIVERFGELDQQVHGGYYPKTRPLVSIEQFSKGGGDQASLWSNQWPSVSKDVDEIAFWKSLRERDGIWDVLISVRQYDFVDQPFEEGGSWVDADVVVIISSAQPAELLKLFPENAVPVFECDDWELTGEKHERTFVPSNMKPLFFWYD